MAVSPVALVQGANRGLGLAFVRILACRTSNVVATCRRPDQAEELQKIPNVEILQVLKTVPFIIRLKNHSVHICDTSGKAPNNSIITCFFVYGLKNHVH